MSYLERLKAMRTSEPNEGSSGSPFTAEEKAEVASQPEAYEPFEGSPNGYKSEQEAADWKVAIEAMALKPAPEGVDPKAWRAMLLGAYTFVDRWGAQAHRLGWTKRDLFRLSSTHPMTRRDMRGAAFLVNECEVVGITETAITLREASGLSSIPKPSLNDISKEGERS